MAINFPDNPTVGQTFTAANRTWTYNGSAWVGDYSSTGNADTIDGIDSSQFLRSDTSDTMNGTLTVTGDVGVGTGSVQGGAALYVFGGENKWTILERGGKKLYLNANYSALDQFAQIAPLSSDNMGLSLSSKDGNPEYLFITTSGNVGIGITAPIAKFESSEGLTARGIATPTNTSVGSVQIGYDGTNGILRTWASSPIKYQSYGHHAFETSGIERIRITSTGNIGIGTTNPTTRLQVNGTITATSYAGDGSNLTGISAGATGGGTDQVFYENDTTVNSNYTITTGKNAMTAGPVEILNNVVVTVPDGSTWTIV